MKNNKFLLILLAGALCSCNDFLDREPLSSVPTTSYLLSESDLADYSANLYDQLTSHEPGKYDLGVFAIDNNSDNQAATAPNSKFVKGESRVAKSDGDWDFGKIRNVNYFINRVRPSLEAGELGGNNDNNKHYLGEMYFFRALVYYKKLIALGDFPILKQWITEDYDVVREASKRRPRNEVARFILSDLDSASYYMKEIAPMTNRLNKKSAILLKSRVALFEGTWEKYHQGTARVPGGPGWPGAKMDYLKDFKIDLNAEINYFLTEAKTAAQIVADAHTLHPNYEAMFNSQSLADVKEVLLWRKYDASLTPAINHFVVGYIQRNGAGNSGYTRSMINTYLMADGLPIYANGSNYQGDESYEKLAANRDPRLAHNTLLPGELLSTKAAFNDYVVNGQGIYYRSPITDGQADQKCPTGYSIKKGLTPDAAQGPTLPSTTACVVFRAGEAYLNYIEADYELNGRLDANSDKYWKALRTRAQMDIDYQKTIQATDLTQELDLARYSGSALVSPTLYNIRRERRIELAAEGFRFQDLKRWRALDMMQNYITEGFDLWSENYKRYTTPTEGVKAITLIEFGEEGPNVSAQSDSKYLLPYRMNTKNLAYNGYNWNQVKYLEPIAFDNFRLTTATPGSPDYNSSTIYQNPGWKIETSSLPEGD